jgi:hypothetical protein
MNSLFLLSPTGEILIERHFRDKTSRSVCKLYWDKVSVSLNQHGGATSSAATASDNSLFDTVPPVMEVPNPNYDNSHSADVSGGGRSCSQDGDKSIYLFSVLRDGLSYLAACPSEVSPLLILEFLHCVANTFGDYFGSPTDENAIKENFSTVYQLLEEMVDNGWPLTTEPNALQDMIHPPTMMGKVRTSRHVSLGTVCSYICCRCHAILHNMWVCVCASYFTYTSCFVLFHSLCIYCILFYLSSFLSKIQQVVTGSNAVVAESLPQGTVSNMPWRKAGVRHSSNEIYVDLVEEIDAIVDANGRVVSSDVNGSIQAQAHLSGVPDLLMTFADPALIDDCSFHPCVRYARYEIDRVVSFVPPDGDFELMKYRVKNAHDLINPPIFCTPQISFGDSEESTQGRITVNVGVKPINSLILPNNRKGGGGGSGSGLVIEDVAVTIPFARVVRTANLTVNIGTILYDEAAKVAKWVIGKLDPSKRPQLTGTLLLLSGDDKPEENPPLQLHWRIPQASVSGVSVSGLSMVGEEYHPYKGVRCITKSGRFQIRCN